jgi:hypothetical protein
LATYKNIAAALGVLVVGLIVAIVWLLAVYV